MRFLCLSILILAFVALSAMAADTSYKQVLITPGTNYVRVRLPLTDVTGKVRAKEKVAGGFGQPIAPSRTILGGKHYLEWQIGYDVPDTNSPSVVPEIKFTRNGETKYGHELAKLIYESLQIGLLSKNDLERELLALRAIPQDSFEENQPMEVETSTNRDPAGFRRAVQLIPQFTKTTPYGWVQIQLKQKQRAVGYQAMVYVCLPMNNVLTMDGQPRRFGRAEPKETVYYDFTRENASFLLDIIQAFGMASQQHNEDLQKILGKVLETAGQTKNEQKQTKTTNFSQFKTKHFVFFVAFCKF